MAFSQEKQALKLNNQKIIGLGTIEDIKIERVPNQRKEIFFVAIKMKDNSKNYYQKFGWLFQFLIFYVDSPSLKAFFEKLKDQKNKGKNYYFHDKFIKYLIKKLIKM